MEAELCLHTHIHIQVATLPKITNTKLEEFHPYLFFTQVTEYNINPLTTNDDYSRHRNSAACYQLVQSVLKIHSALAEKVGQGEVGGSTALADSAWWLLQLAIEWAWSALGGLFFCFLVQTSVENGPFTL